MGVTNTMQGIATHNGQIAVGGFGTSVTNTSLMFWDGYQWYGIGLFNYGTSQAFIYSVAYVGNTLYAAGIFTNINGVPISGLARWDGTSWSSVGFAGNAYALAVSGTDLYVGGQFTNLDASSVMMTNVGRWDGSAWHAIGSGLGTPPGGSVRCLTFNGSTLYAGGGFTNAGSQVASNLAVWNGTTWSGVGGGANSTVLSLAANGGIVYAGGFFTQVGATPASEVAQWNGSSWSALGTGVGGNVNAIGFLGGQVCVAGGFNSAGGLPATNFAIWNGSTWSAAGSNATGNGLTASGYGIISNGTNVYVAGAFGIAGGEFANGVASWDGTNWSGFGPPGRMNGLGSPSTTFASDGSNLYAGGQFTYAGQTNCRYVGKFDGTNWNSLGGFIGPLGGTTTVRAMAYASNNLYVGGTFSTVGGAYALNFAVWDGTNWSTLGSGPGGAVASITVRPDGIYVAGAPQSGANFSGPYFVRWTGSAWQSVLNYNSDDTFIQFLLSDSNIGMDAVAFLGTDIYVGGHFNITWHDPSLTVFTNCPNIMRFDGTYARVVGTGLNSNVIAMAVLSTNLYVAGLFTNAGGITASHIAMWDGNNWFAIGGGVVGTGTVSALTTLGNYLYAGGTFTNMGGVPASRIARWDGTNWTALGSGVSAGSGSVQGMAFVGNDLWVGGGFRAAGGKSSYSIGRWNDQLNFNTPQISNPSWPGNGPFRGRLIGLPGQTNVIQASTNLTSWVPVLTNSVGIYDFTDASSSSNRYRFYRAKLGP